MAVLVFAWAGCPGAACPSPAALRLRGIPRAAHLGPGAAAGAGGALPGAAARVWCLCMVAGRGGGVKSKLGGVFSALLEILRKLANVARRDGQSSSSLSVNSFPEPNFLHVKAPGYGEILQGSLIPGQSPLLPQPSVLGCV